MLDDSDKDAIRAFVARAMQQFNGDITLVTQAIQAEYGKQPEHVRYALRCVERSKQKEEPLLPKPKGPVWVRFEKEDDESGRFTDIELLPNKGGSGTRCFKVRSKHGYVTMFLKYLYGSQATQRELDFARALREYRSYNNLKHHQNIVEVYDTAWVRTEEGEFPFVATEFLDGVNLMEWREKHQNAPTPHQNGEIIRIIASTLQCLLDVDKGKVREIFGPTARAEVMHLDLKPNNVMVLYRMPLDLQVEKLMDSLFLESVSHAQRWEAAQAINKVLELESPHTIREHDVKTRRPFGDKLIAAIQVHVAFKPNKFVDFLVAVQEQQVGLSANNPLKTFMIQHREGEKIKTVDQTNLKLIDFGSGGPAEAATAHSSAKANEHYKAPERFHSDGQRPTPTKAWDIYSLGAILYYLSTGKHLDSPERHTNASWHKYLSHIDLHDPDLTLICQKCLAYEPTDRFSSPGQLEESLSDWLNDHPIRHLGKKYSWWKREVLLIQRCQKKDIKADQYHFIAQMALVVAAAIAVACSLYLWLLSRGVSANDALFQSTLFLNQFCLCLFAVCAIVVRMRLSAIRIFVPMICLVACISMTYVVLNSKVLFHPTTDESNMTVLFILPLIALFNVVHGNTKSAFSFMSIVGWMILLVSPLARMMLYRESLAQYILIVVDACEIMACLAVASYGFSTARYLNTRSQLHEE